jgi:YegS/Rv2252/BmrU family lipid kinase
MPTEQPLSFLFVINPKAGGQEKGSWQDAIKARFEGQPHQFEVLETTGKDDLGRLKKRLADLSPDRLIAVGGDGTLKLVAEAAIGKDVTIGMLPAGSANGMASELSIPAAAEKALDVVLGDEVHKLDGIKINGELSIHLSDIGLNAQLIQYFEQGESRGQLGYAKEILRTLKQHKTLPFTITVDGKKHKRKAAMVIIANGRMYGSGVVLNEFGRLDDGKLEVIILRHISFFRILRCLILRKATPGPQQEVLSGCHVKITTPISTPFQVDGEFLGETHTVEAQVLPGALSILVSPPQK